MSDTRVLPYNMTNKEIITLVRNVLKQSAPDADYILYGSRARGDNRPDSDVDILVILPNHYEGREFVLKQTEISNKLYEISLEYELDISPLITIEKIFNQRKTPFTVNVMNEGIRL